LKKSKNGGRAGIHSQLHHFPRQNNAIHRAIQANPQRFWINFFCRLQTITRSILIRRHDGDIQKPNFKTFAEILFFELLRKTNPKTNIIKQLRRCSRFFKRLAKMF
jgi:hypothetical protein